MRVFRRLRCPPFEGFGADLVSSHSQSNVPSLSKATSINTSGTASCLAWHPSKMLLAYASEDFEGGRPSGAVRIWNL